MHFTHLTAQYPNLAWPVLNMLRAIILVCSWSNHQHKAYFMTKMLDILCNITNTSLKDKISLCSITKLEGYKPNHCESHLYSHPV